MIYFQHDYATLYCGDVIEQLANLTANSIDCCVTSPPYWGLRDYGVAGQIGMETSPELFVAKMVEVFAAVGRVLKDEGTLWLNLGDSYARTGGTQGGGNRELLHMEGKRQRMCSIPASSNLKAKDLVGIPWRVAFALQADGWYLRSDIIWAKPAPMPESVTDRPTRSHEYIFLLSKSPNYYYDHEAIKEPSVSGHASGNGYGRPERLSYSDERGARGSDTGWKPSRPSAAKGSFLGKTEEMADTGQNAFRAVTEMRNKRDVWTVGSEPFPGAHFATFPTALIEPCIIAGCPKEGTVLDPFTGSGTAGEVANRYQRKFVGVELNPEYCKLAKSRLAQQVLAL